MSIRIESLTKRFGPQTAVNGISFSVAPGEIVGFLGPNGAGKSTTLKMITGYLQPDAGQVEVCGSDVTKHPMQIRKKIGYLPELNPLYYDLYVREYLQFIGEAHEIDKPKHRIEEVIGIVGLSKEAHKRIGALSKGYKQRVGLAAAIMHDPEVLILDEPTTGLDPNQILEIREVIRQQGKNKTVLFSSHILSEVEAICQRVVIIHQGNLVANDTLDKIRQGAGRPTVLVQFREEVPADKWQTLTGILQVTRSGTNEWQFETENADALQKQILHLALQEGLNIVSLHIENRRLETIFRSLTTSGQSTN
ncbi:MAG: gliding motility-associated ABC transporter ATP-binding subunit GldA [Bacteroidota bacterium]